MTYKGEGEAQATIRKDPAEKQAVILKIIKDNPGMHHNELIRKIVQKPLMAKRTAEKTLESLLSLKVIDVHQSGNKKYYSLPSNFDKLDPQVIERGMNVWFTLVETEIKRLETDYKKNPPEGKTSMTIFILNAIFFALNGFALLTAFSNSEKNIYQEKEVAFKKNIKKIFDIILDDPDYQIVYPIVRDALIRTNLRIDYKSMQ